MRQMYFANVPLRLFCISFIFGLLATRAISQELPTAYNGLELVDKRVAIVRLAGGERHVAGAASSTDPRCYVMSVDPGFQRPFGHARNFQIHRFSVDDPAEVTFVREVKGRFAKFVASHSYESPGDSEPLVANLSHNGRISIEKLESGEVIAKADRTDAFVDELPLFYVDRRQIVFSERKRNSRNPDDGYAFVVIDAEEQQEVIRIDLDHEIPCGIAVSPVGTHVAFISNRFKQVTRNLLGETIEGAEQDLSKGLVASTDSVGVIRLCKVDMDSDGLEIVFEEMLLSGATYTADGLRIIVGCTDEGRPELQDIFGIGVKVPVSHPSAALLVLDSANGAIARKIQIDAPSPETPNQGGYPRVTDLTCSRDGTLLAVGTGNYNRGGKWGNVAVLETDQLMRCRSIAVFETNTLPFVTLSDRRFCISADSAGHMLIWKIAESK